jgi:hypothetical protein
LIKAVFQEEEVLKRRYKMEDLVTESLNKIESDLGILETRR